MIAPITTTPAIFRTARVDVVGQIGQSTWLSEDMGGSFTQDLSSQRYARTNPVSMPVFGNASALRSASGSREDREDAFDVVAELPHEVAQERRRRVVGDLAVVGEDARARR